MYWKLSFNRFLRVCVCLQTSVHPSRDSSAKVSKSSVSIVFYRICLFKPGRILPCTVCPYLHLRPSSLSCYLFNSFVSHFLHALVYRNLLHHLVAGRHQQIQLKRVQPISLIFCSYSTTFFIMTFNHEK